MFERELRDLIYTPRWNVGFVRTTRQQSVVEHSYYVAIYASEIADVIQWKGDKESLLMYALYHDVDESSSSDLPMPLKKYMKKSLGVGYFLVQKWINKVNQWRCPSTVKWLSPNEEIEEIVKIADILEACVFLAEEASFGNNNNDEVLAYLYEELTQMVNDSSVVSDCLKSRLLVEIRTCIGYSKNFNSKFLTGKEHF